VGVWEGTPAGIYGLLGERLLLIVPTTLSLLEELEEWRLFGFAS
jgi:hypothetical protein